MERKDCTKCKKIVISKIVMMRISSTLRRTTRTLTSTSPAFPDATVKRSQSIGVHNLIQKIESHPQREALQNDLQQRRAFNPSSKESKDAIMAAGNTELCEIRAGHTVTGTGKHPGCKEYHTANQLQKRSRKKKYDNIHDRFIRDKTFRKTMIELGRSEEVILEMDRLESENHSHIVTKAEIDVYRGNWWNSLERGEFRYDADKASTFKKALSTLYRLKKA